MVEGGLVERELVGLESALVEALGYAHVGITVWMVEGGKYQLSYASETACRILGHPVDVLRREHPLFFVAPEFRADLADRTRRRLAGEDVPSHFETVVLTAEGKRKPIEIGSARTPHGSGEAIISFFRDISDRRVTEEALARSEARFRLLIEKSPDGIVVLREGRLVYANPAVVRMFGYARSEDLLGRSIVDLTVPEDRPILLSRLPAVAAGESIPPQVYRGLRADGGIVTAEIVSLATEFEGTSVVLGFARDITERERLRAQAIQADRMATLGFLAAGVAHEINNPLAYLSVLLQSLEREVGPAAEPRLTDARQAVERIAAIVRDLRTFSRPDRAEIASADVSRVLASALKMADHEIKHRAELVTAIEVVPPVAASEARLGQVFLNLLVNAIQALPEESDVRPVIRVSARAVGDRVVVEVTDSGVGMTPTVRARIFDPFFTTKPAGAGTGLGLSICRDIINAYGGDITVESEVGRGSTFRVSFPTAVSTSPAVAEPPVAVRAPRARILVVDDEALLAMALQRELEREHDVAVATSGRQALEQLQAASFDCVLCDVMMADLSGVDLYGEVKRLRPGQEARFVFMTGGACTPRATAFLESVANPRLDKPFAIEAVDDLVRRTLAASV